MTPYGHELVNALPVASSSTFWTIHAIQVQASVDDIIHVDAQMEVTNDIGHDVAFCHFLAWHSSQTIFSGTPPSSASYANLPPVQPGCENVTPNMHHSMR